MGVPIIRIIIYWGVYWGFPTLASALIVVHSFPAKTFALLHAKGMPSGPWGDHENLMNSKVLRGRGGGRPLFCSLHRKLAKKGPKPAQNQPIICRFAHKRVPSDSETSWPPKRPREGDHSQQQPCLDLADFADFGLRGFQVLALEPLLTEMSNTEPTQRCADPWKFHRSSGPMPVCELTIRRLGASLKW